MHALSTRMVVDCPVCGRPLELDSDSLWHAMNCAHCGGGFVAYERPNGTIGASKLNGAGSLVRADRLLKAFHETAVRKQRLRVSESARQVLLQGPEDSARVPSAVAIVVEPRDDIFRRVAVEAALAGLRVLRARTAVDALTLTVRHRTALVISNTDLPDQSGWLLAAKLRWINPSLAIWLYQAGWTDYHHGLARYLRVDRLLCEENVADSLADRIVELLASPGDTNVPDQAMPAVPSRSPRDECCC